MKNVLNPILDKSLKAGVFLSTLMPLSAFAAPGTEVDPALCTPGTGTITDAAKCSQAPQSQPDNLFAAGGIFPTIANVLIFLVGAIAVIMLILGGLQYVISNGDSKRVESAKNTILYAIIGIVIAILAFAAVSFVTGSLVGAPAATN